MTRAAGKWARRDGGRLLDLDFRYRRHPDRRPLLVSGGTSADKRRAIRRSDYLTFALRQLALRRDDIVILGSRLDPADAHITEAIDAGPARRIAVGLRPDPRGRGLARRMAELSDLFADRHTVLFFNTTSHPLAQPTLRVR